MQPIIAMNYHASCRRSLSVSVDCSSVRLRKWLPGVLYYFVDCRVLHINTGWGEGGGQQDFFSPNCTYPMDTSDRPRWVQSLRITPSKAVPVWKLPNMNSHIFSYPSYPYYWKMRRQDSPSFYGCAASCLVGCPTVVTDGAITSRIEHRGAANTSIATDKLKRSQSRHADRPTAPPIMSLCLLHAVGK